MYRKKKKTIEKYYELLCNKNVDSIRTIILENLTKIRISAIRKVNTRHGDKYLLIGFKEEILSFSILKVYHHLFFSSYRKGGIERKQICRNLHLQTLKEIILQKETFRTRDTKNETKFQNLIDIINNSKTAKIFNIKDIIYIL